MKHAIILITCTLLSCVHSLKQSRSTNDREIERLLKEFDEVSGMGDEDFQEEILGAVTITDCNARVEPYSRAITLATIPKKTKLYVQFVTKGWFHTTYQSKMVYVPVECLRIRQP